MAAALPLVCQTAWEALHLRARIQPGQTVLIHAGAGGVGHIAIQIARLHGCRVIATAGRDESIAFCREVLRVDEVIDYRTTDFAARARELSNGKGIPVVLDTVGGDVFHANGNTIHDVLIPGTPQYFGVLETPTAAPAMPAPGPSATTASAQTTTPSMTANGSSGGGGALTWPALFALLGAGVIRLARQLHATGAPPLTHSPPTRRFAFSSTSTASGRSSQ